MEMPDKNDKNSTAHRDDLIRDKGNKVERDSATLGFERDVLNHSTIKVEQPTKEQTENFLQDDD